MKRSAFFFACATAAILRVAAAAPAVTNAVQAPAVIVPPPLERLESRLFDFTYADAQEVAENFNRTWRGWRGPAWEVSNVAVAFPEANAVMVTAPAAILEDCSRMAAKIDRKPKQVYIEARFVEVANQALFNLGIDWHVLNNLSGTAGFSAGISQQNIPDNISEYSQTFSGSSSKGSQTYKFVKGGVADNSFFQGTLSFSQMEIILSAFEGSSDVHTFSNPKVIVASGKKAVVDMTTKQPNVVLSTKRVVKSGENTLDLDQKVTAIPGEDKLMFAKEAFYSWGISLEVTPRVMTNGLINVRIVPTLSSHSGDVEPTISDSTTATMKYPIIDVQRILTEFNMKSGMTAVIGGLSKTEEVDTDQGIPWLCEIPWLGHTLFGGKLRQKIQRDVLVFVTVGESDPERMRTDEGVPKNAVIGRGYTTGRRLEPGDRTNAVEGVMSLDLRPLEDRAAENK